MSAVVRRFGIALLFCLIVALLSAFENYYWSVFEAHRPDSFLRIFAASAPS